ncbi:MAG: outer membrane protein insertion porin family [Verrucomicrobiales bacterium]|jgi:outer membrane protein insertion porin family
MGNSIPMMAMRFYRVGWLTISMIAMLMIHGLGQEDSAPSVAGSVEFRGLDELSADQAQEIIKHQLRYLAEKGVSQARADDAAYFLAIGMRRMGFDEANVDWQIEGNRVVLLVTESQQRKLGEVEVTGNNVLGTDVIEALLMQDTKARLKGLLKSARLPFVEDDVNKGVSAIRALYANLGYYDATVELTELDAEEKVDVRLTIAEGPLYRVGTVTIESPTAELRGALDSLAREFEATPYTPGSATVLQGRVLELFRNAGYSEAEIASLEPTLQPENADKEILAELRMSIDAGQRRKLGNVTVSGNEKVVESFFLSRFEPLKGQPYDEGRANRILRRMLRSGAFSKVELQGSPVPDSDVLDIAILVEETPAREVGVYAGVGSWEGYIVGGTFQHHNLFGAVRRFDSRIEFSGRGITGDINVFEPWALGERTTLTSGLYAKGWDNDGYTKFQIGGQFELHYELSDYAKMSLFSRASYTEILDHYVVDEELGDDSYLQHSVGATFSYDRRDNPVVPTTGYIFNVSADVASAVIGSEVDFLRSTGRLSYYKTIGPVRLQAGARAGIIIPFGDTEQLPIDLRHFSGGSSTVRSFPERELGPQDRRGNPIGGEFYTIFNTEASMPVWKGLRLAGFADAGNLLSQHDDLSLDEMHHAAGLGLRYDLPIGPLRLDYGWNLNRKEDEPEGAFHFGIGVSF